MAGYLEEQGATLADRFLAPERSRKQGDLVGSPSKN